MLALLTGCKCAPHSLNYLNIMVEKGRILDNWGLQITEGVFSAINNMVGTQGFGEQVQVPGVTLCRVFFLNRVIALPCFVSDKKKKKEKFTNVFRCVGILLSLMKTNSHHFGQWEAAYGHGEFKNTDWSVLGSLAGSGMWAMWVALNGCREAGPEIIWKIISPVHAINSGISSMTQL